ncbi:beta-lactamase/transpeptidase-like protein, partial [Pleomassaria siparia CBS 279.74]
IGPEFPPPTDLANHPVWKKAIQDITATFDYIDTSNITGIDKFSYSIQVFSTNPGPATLWERYRTAKNLPSNTAGVKTVDGDTVYRLGSLTKLYTVLAWLAELGDEHWNQPITKYIPELIKYPTDSTAPNFDAVKNTAWKDITIGSLASQVSGLGRDCESHHLRMETHIRKCIANKGLDRWNTWGIHRNKWFARSLVEFIEGLNIMYPSVPPWQTPTYSNTAYQLFAYAMENVSGKRFTSILTDRIIKPMGLNRTYYTKPADSVGILPGNNTETFWDVSLGDAGPGGNMYSSANDLSTFGRSILSSKVIKPSLTRRWLQPAIFSADVLASVGAPWGVRRIQLDKENQPHRTLTVFTKAGTFQKYTSFITLLKDFNIGFTIMMAGEPAISNFGGADLLGTTLIPAFQAVARDSADRLFSGHYVSKDVQNGETINSTLTINTEAGKPGLGIVSWISNGTDMLDVAIKLGLGTTANLVRPEGRLYYSQLEAKTESGKRQAFKAVFEETGYPGLGQPLFSTDCGQWVSVTATTYGSLPLDEFVFNFDSSGKVVSVINLALRMTLYKTGN